MSIDSSNLNTFTKTEVTHHIPGNIDNLGLCESETPERQGDLEEP